VRCEQCGDKILRGESIQVTRCEPDGPATRQGQRTRIVRQTLCRPCSRKRGNMIWFLLGAFAFLLVGMFLFGLLT
jgi:hypothetical protein